MIEVQDIFKRYDSEFSRQFKIPPHQRKAIWDVQNCRDSALGGHVDQCDECGNLHVSYNSCRNRHCPKCQNVSREQWLFNREQELLDIGYFHIVFTIPASLNPIALRNQKIVYGILFRAASESLLELAADRKYLGANIGILAVLHTWGHTLMDHPHVHCLVPGGGLALDGLHWMNSSKKFFIPVKVLSRKFRGKFLALLKQAALNKELDWVGQIESFKEPELFQVLLDQLYQTEWVVYAKKPFAGAAHVLRYLGRYTHRVAISNQRIIACEEGIVTFKYQDYRDGRQKHLSISAVEFIRRFLLHILPPRFVKIRYYGLFGNRVRKLKAQVCRRLLHMKLKPVQKLSKLELIKERFGFDPSVCPVCGGRMARRMDLESGHAPPVNEV